MPTALDRKIDASIALLTGPGGPLQLGTVTIRGNEYPVLQAAPPTLRDFFAAMAAQHGNKDFLVYNDERYSFAQVHEQGLKIAAALQRRYGIAKGDRVAIAMRNYPEWAMAYFGLLHFGAIVVPLNAWWQPNELRYGLRDSGARLVIADEERARRLAALTDVQLPVVTVRAGPGIAAGLGDGRLEELLVDAPAVAWQLPPLYPEDDATIMYTSGSTGYPKGAVATHRSVVQAVFNFLAMGMIVAHATGRAPDPNGPQLASLLPVPLFHITGSVPILLGSYAAGRKLVVMHKWDAGEALRLIEAERVTNFLGVPTMSLEMMTHPDREKYDLGSLMEIGAGGAARPAEHVHRLAETFKGTVVSIGYGLTETNATGASNTRENYLAKPSSTGRPQPPLIGIRILDEEGNDLPANRMGEICIRSAANVRGYWNRPEETAKAFTDDGWFRTGDLGYLDEDGYVFIVDRKKDIIIRGGENISCQEVEAAIYAHPAVAEASVFGLPDERLGEIVGAVVYLKPGEMLDAEALIDFAKGELAAFKVPARLWISPEPLPKLGSEKFDKISLRKIYHARA